MGYTGNAYSIWFRKPLGKHFLGMPRGNSGNNIKLMLRW
jgi:hypothetical protein